ncbi:hypothetical protein M422DRAFT_54177 [Sphaerobolus stellatus SS14]|uniref:F-box domain-containing protein n=1 Tax=Sphaerobolus stellatus (strain SS14) TaxID=990650 RepID=A0A0C9TIN5_SPHS4|nr:hypothetical protein M422DRAFT_54177 [Sphaerobolus stellatus SS14]
MLLTAGFFINTKTHPPDNLDFFEWTRYSSPENRSHKESRFGVSWEAHWQALYIERLEIIVALQQVSHSALAAMDPFFLKELWFTHPKQLITFLGAFPPFPRHRLLRTIRHLRVDFPLGQNIWTNRTNPFVAIGWPREGRHDIFWNLPPNSISDFASCERRPEFSSAPKKYLTRLLSGRHMDLTCLRISTPIYDAHFHSVIRSLACLQELAIDYCADIEWDLVLTTQKKVPVRFPCLKYFTVSRVVRIAPLVLVSQWLLPELKLFSCCSRLLDPNLPAALKSFGHNLRTLVIRGSWMDSNEYLALQDMCPQLLCLEFQFNWFTPRILGHRTIQTIVAHGCDVLASPSPELYGLRDWFDNLFQYHNSWLALMEVVDSAWPPRSFNYNTPEYFSWWEKARVEAFWECSFNLVDSEGGKMRGDIPRELKLLVRSDVYQLPSQDQDDPEDSVW